MLLDSVATVISIFMGVELVSTVFLYHKSRSVDKISSNAWIETQTFLQPRAARHPADSSVVATHVVIVLYCMGLSDQQAIIKRGSGHTIILSPLPSDYTLLLASLAHQRR